MLDISYKKKPLAEVCRRELGLTIFEVLGGYERIKKGSPVFALHRDNLSALGSRASTSSRWNPASVRIRLKMALTAPPTLLFVSNAFHRWYILVLPG